MSEGSGFTMRNGDAESKQGKKLPAVDFSTFVLSLYSSALVQLGEIEDPTTGLKVKNLDLARQTVDIMIMLSNKTHGNLDNDEASLIKSLIHEAQLAFVRAKK